MLAGTKKKRGRIFPERLLEGVPQRNRSVELKQDEEGSVLWAPIRPRWWMKPPFSWIMGYRDQKGFSLDALGLEIWQACDGTRNIEQIVEEFAARHRTSFHEARIVVMQFIQLMTRRELIAIVFSGSGESLDETNQG